MAETVDIAPKLEDLFPIGKPPFVIELIPGASGQWVRSDEPAAVAVFRTILWEPKPEGGGLQIRNIKEQELSMGWPSLYEDRERVAAFVAALAAVIAEIELDKLETLMPCDLICTDALELRRAQTQEDFDKALRAKKRLGALLE